MSLIRSYDIVTMVIDEAVKHYGNTWALDANMMENLQTSCNIIDRLIPEFDCESIEAGVNDTTMALHIELICPDMILEYGRSHPFFEAIKGVKSIQFSAAGDNLKINLEFTGLWKHKD